MQKGAARRTLCSSLHNVIWLLDNSLRTGNDNIANINGGVHAET